MSRAETLTDVANLALASVGEKLIANIDSDGRIEGIVNNVLCETIRQVQSEIQWGELRTIVEPSQLPDMYPPAPSFFQYQLPTNFIDVVELSSGADWFVENGMLITTDSAPMLIYKRYSEEVTEWSAYMVEMIYRKLAVNMAMHLTQNAQVLQVAQSLYKESELKNLTKSSNRRRRFSQRARGYGNLTARRYSGRYF